MFEEMKGLNLKCISQVSTNCLSWKMDGEEVCSVTDKRKVLSLHKPFSQSKVKPLKRRCENGRQNKQKKKEMIYFKVQTFILLLIPSFNCPLLLIFEANNNHNKSNKNNFWNGIQKSKVDILDHLFLMVRMLKGNDETSNWRCWKRWWMMWLMYK